MQDAVPELLKNGPTIINLILYIVQNNVMQFVIVSNTVNIVNII